MLLLLFFYSSLFEALPEWDAQSAKFTPLYGGITNQNMLLTLKERRYFVRFGGKTRDLLGATYQAEVEGLRLGFSPELIAEDPATGLLILEYIESEPFQLRDFPILEQCALQLRTLHTSQQALSRTLLPDQIIATYLQHLPKNKRADQILKRLPPLIYDTLAPCHLDLHRQNMLKKGDRLYFIDWEYSALSEPLFDLAVLSSCERFSDEEMSRLLFYYNPQATEADEKKLYTLRALADLRWALWSLIQDNKTLAERFFKEAESRSRH